MALVFKKGRRVLYSITISLLSEQGQPVEQTFKVGYRLLTKTEQQEMMAIAYKAAGLNVDGETLRELIRAAGDASKQSEYDKKLKSHIYTIEGVSDEDGNDIPYSDDLLNALMNDLTIGGAIDEGLFKASQDEPPKN